ncbi:MAG: dephospho-CoA kinase [Cytophagales bacterium]|nr:dephospho-CoA kinase [Cytophagales bacterium]
MKTVGITGGIGAGKSIVSRIFQTLGAPVYDADSRAKRLMNEHEAIREQVIELFGAESYDQGVLNREHIGKIAFHQPKRLEQLNAVVHPAVAEDFANWAQEQSFSYVLKEAALLVETGSYKSLDYLILVSAPVDIRTQRVLKRDPHRNAKDVQAIIERQLSEEQKAAIAQTIITNDESQLVIPQVLRTHAELV